MAGLNLCFPGSKPFCRVETILTSRQLCIGTHKSLVMVLLSRIFYAVNNVVALSLYPRLHQQDLRLEPSNTSARPLSSNATTREVFTPWKPPCRTSASSPWTEFLQCLSGTFEALRHTLRQPWFTRERLLTFGALPAEPLELVFLFPQPAITKIPTKRVLGMPTGRAIGERFRST